MESDPSQCALPDGTVFVEPVQFITEDEARSLAEASECGEEGEIESLLVYGRYSHVWVFSVDSINTNCLTYCKVNGETKESILEFECIPQSEIPQPGSSQVQDTEMPVINS